LAAQSVNAISRAALEIGARCADKSRFNWRVRTSHAESDHLPAPEYLDGAEALVAARGRSALYGLSGGAQNRRME
jgi:hypothetical protein